jgi:hypothetical protein
MHLLKDFRALCALLVLSSTSYEVQAIKNTTARGKIANKNHLIHIFTLGNVLNQSFKVIKEAALADGLLFLGSFRDKMFFASNSPVRRISNTKPHLKF